MRLLVMIAGSFLLPVGVCHGQQASVGVNLESDWLFTDVVMQAAHNQWNTTSDLWGSTAATVDSSGWPTQDFSLEPWGTGSQPNANLQNTGTWTLVFNGKAKVTCWNGYLIQPVNSNGTNGTYNSTTNTTTATMADTSTGGENLALIFTNTQRTSTSATNTGLTNIHFYRPTSEGASTSYAPGTLFTNATLALGEQFSTIRFLDETAAIDSTQKNWSDRNLPGFWNQNGTATHPMAYEYAVAYCNATNRDLYLNIPFYATDAYMTNLAELIKYGSDGVNPYPTTQTNPVWAPLNSNLHVYFELSDEMWNTGFQQAHQNYNIVHDDSTANNAEWAVLNFDGAAAGNLWTGTWRRVAKRIIEMSNDFRAVYGNSAMPPNANPTVRPLLEYQYGNGQDTAGTELQFANDYYNNGDGVTHVATPEPVNYFIYGGGGATYFNSNDDTASTVDAIFASGIPNTGYTAAVQKDSALAKGFGLKRVAYEGGWSIYDGTVAGGTENVSGSPGELAKYDSRAATGLESAHAIFQQSGGDLDVFYAASSWDANWVWGMTDQVFNLTVPLYAGVSAIDSGTAPTITLGNAIAGTGSTTLAYANLIFANNDYNAGLPDNGIIGFVPLVSTAGNYQINLQINSTSSNRYVRVFLDGQLMGGGAIKVPVSSSAQNVPIGISTLGTGQHGLVVEGQYASNNNYSGNSCSFTSFTMTELPPPQITTQPQSQTVTTGTTVSFSVAAGGTGLTYQWQFNGSPISGQTTSTLTLSNVTTAQTGNYNVLVTNTGGTTPSNTATLTVQVPPLFTSTPLINITGVGDTYSFTFTASGTPASTFTLTSGNLPQGLTLSSSGVLSGTPTVAGTYTGVITASNGAGTPVTQNFTLTIADLTSDSPTMPPWALVIFGLLLFSSQCLPQMKRGNALSV